MTVRRFFASTPRGLADLLAGELPAFGALDVREGRGGVSFSGTLEVAYRACLESRIASRVYLPLLTLEAPTTEAFYAQLLAHDWSQEISDGATLACEFSGQHPTIIHSQFGAQKMKDAICDQLRSAMGWRPDIQPDEPGVRVHAHVYLRHINWGRSVCCRSAHLRLLPTLFSAFSRFARHRAT